MEKLHYTESIFFEIKLTSRYLELMGNQAFEKLKIKISFEEYLILDIISCNEGICNIDVAKMLLRDRSNVGKIIASFEKQGLVKIKPNLRNNRSVKKVYITTKGTKLCNEVYEILIPYLGYIKENINNTEKNAVSNHLKKLREILDEVVTTKI